MAFPVTVVNGDVVFVHVSGGKRLSLKPGLNIIGGVQPRGVREVSIADIADIADILELVICSDNDDAAILVMLDCDSMLAMLIVALSLAIDIEVAAAAIMVDKEVIAVVMLAMCLAFIPAIVIGAGLSPRPVPASRM